MHKKGELKSYSLVELTDQYFKKIGTPKRDKFENKLKFEIEIFHISMKRG